MSEAILRFLALVRRKPPMRLMDYQQRAHEFSKNTIIGDKPWLYPTLGLAAEAGELINKVKKVFRDRDGALGVDGEDGLVSELGDVLWYVAETATQLGLDLDEIAHTNLQKLQDRKDRDLISGSGDRR